MTCLFCKGTGRETSGYGGHVCLPCMGSGSICDHCGYAAPDGRDVCLQCEDALASRPVLPLDTFPGTEFEEKTRTP